jgi:hypothetical protein
MQTYQARSVSFAICPHRYEQDFYIGLFTMTAMYLVFVYLGNANLSSQKRIFLSSPVPLRIGFLY